MPESHLPETPGAGAPDPADPVLTLLADPPTPPMSLDAGDVRAHGQRRVVRRRVAGGVGGIAPWPRSP